MTIERRLVRATRLSAARNRAKTRRFERERDKALGLADSYKDATADLLLGMAHDINNAVNVIRGYSDLLSRGELTAGQREDLENVKRQAALAIRITRRYEQIARVVGRGWGCELKEFDLWNAVDDSLDFMNPKPGRLRYKGYSRPLLHRGEEYHSDMEREPVKVYGNQDITAVVLENLFANAAKYALGEVEFDVTYEGDKGLMVVRNDVEKPITPDQKTRIFDAFYQRPGDEDRGTGLGLYVSKNLAERQGGSLVLECDDRDVRFKLALPRYIKGQKS